MEEINLECSRISAFRPKYKPSCSKSLLSGSGFRTPLLPPKGLIMTNIPWITPEESYEPAQGPAVFTLCKLFPPEAESHVALEEVMQEAQDLRVEVQVEAHRRGF